MVWIGGILKIKNKQMATETYIVQTFQPDHWAQEGQRTKHIRDAAEIELHKHVPGYLLKVKKAEVISVEPGSTKAQHMAYYKLKVTYTKTPKRSDKQIYIKHANFKDIPHIIELQIKNHQNYLLAKDSKKGFVTLLTPQSYLEKIILNKKGGFSQIYIAIDKKSNACLGYLIALMKYDVQSHPFMNEFVKMVDVHTGKKPNNTLYIAQIGVDRKYFGCGIGKQLYRHLFSQLDEHFEESPVDHVITEVSPDNHSSILFHEKMGFRLLKAYTNSNKRIFHIIEKENSIKVH